MSDGITMNRFGKKLYRLITYLPFKLGLAIVWLVTIPFIMIFNWNKIWQLLIAHEENCSLEEAQNLMKTMSKYKFSRWNICFPSERFGYRRPLDVDSMSGIDTSRSTNPAYYSNPGNIYHSSVYRD